MAKINTEKIKNGISYFKAHWKNPPEGKYVSFREYVDITIGIGANYSSSMIISKFISFAASCYLMMYHYKLPYLVFAVITIINMPLSYLFSLIGWVINDNLGFLPKKTELSPHLLIPPKLVQ